MAKTLGFVFKKYINLEFLNSLENCLLIIDNLCEEIYNHKENFNVATAGSLKKLLLFI